MISIGMKERGREETDRALRSAMLGYLLIRALPMAAISAGWRLSAALGVTVGEGMAVLIFVLGCAIVIVAQDIADVRIYRCICCAAVLLYTITAFCFDGEWKGKWLVALDCLLTASAALSGWGGGALAAPILITAGAAAGLLTANSIRTEMLTPVSAALLAGIAVTCIISDSQIKAVPMMLGMAVAMVTGIFI